MLPSRGAKQMLLCTLLCVFLQYGACAMVTGQCSLGGRYNEAKIFAKNSNGRTLSTHVDLPCRYLMARFSCGGVETEVMADNSYDELEDLPFLTGVHVTVTARNSAGKTSIQHVTITNATFSKYLDKEDYSASPWSWSSSGGDLDPEHKVTGSYDVDTKYAVLTGHGVVISFYYVSPYRFRRSLKKQTLRMQVKCDEDSFRFIESEYPKSVCGSFNSSFFYNGHDDLDLDYHHYVPTSADTLVTRQQVPQPDPVCQTLVDSGEKCKGVGEKLYACSELYDNTKDCLFDQKKNPLKLFAECMRVECGKKAADDTCSILNDATLTCEKDEYAHVDTEELRSLAGCPAITTPFPPTTTTPSWWERYGGPAKECYEKDRSRSSYGSKVAGKYSSFFKRSFYSVLPCRFKFADVQCGSVRARVLTDREMSGDGFTYIDAVTVDIKTEELAPWQTLQLSNKKFKKFLQKGVFTKPLWKWSVEGKDKPDKSLRIQGAYNETLNAGEVVAGGLRVTYTYTDQSDDARAQKTLVTVRCDDPEFTSIDSYPASLCGSPSDHYFTSVEGLGEDIPHDPHHRHFPKDPVILARQNIPQPDSLCGEVQQMVQSGKCMNTKLGDALFVCHNLLNYQTYYSYRSYFTCVVENKLDYKKIFVSCLRVLCGDKKPSRKTCGALKKVSKVCGDTSDKFIHTKISELLVNC